MSYEEDYRKPYSSPCACGRGILRYYRIVESNDWGQQKEYDTSVEILCDFCKEHYHYEHTHYGGGVLVPNDLSIPAPIPAPDKRFQYTPDEEFIEKHDKSIIEEMIADMTAPKHRLIKDLTYLPAIEYANERVRIFKKKALGPMINNLRRILSQYDELAASREKKAPRIETYRKKVSERDRIVLEVEKQSFLPTFIFDAEQDKLDREGAKKAQEEYNENHKFDPFDARVTYHDSCRVNFTGHYWDSLHILECVDPQYLILDKPQYGTAKITIVKKYKCKCIICGKEIVVDSSGFNILYDEERGYYPAPQCDCHSVSSFEAKTMAILNDLGISYAREVSFDGLVGDYGHPLRFDFALFDREARDEKGNNIIRLLLELQGPHHYKQGEYDEYGDFVEDNASLSAKARSEKQMRYDSLKQQYCAEHGIPLELIKYTYRSYEKLEDQIAGVLRKYNLA